MTTYQAYIDKIERDSRIKGLLVSGTIHGLLLLALFLLSLKLPYPPPEEKVETLMIEFGGGSGSGDDWEEAGSTGSGGESSAEVIKVKVVQNNPTQSPASATAVVKNTSGEKVLTQNTAEAVAIAEAKRQADAKAKADAERKAKEAEAAKLKAMLSSKLKNSGTGPGSGSGTGTPGAGSGNGSGSGSGDGSGSGWGDGDGDGSGNGEGNGSGDGIGYDLAGRKMVKAPTISDNSQKTGKVAIRVKVDKSGKVVSAEYTSKGSTTTDSYLVDLARKAAMNAKFNSDANASEEQVGVIYFTFRVQ